MDDPFMIEGLDEDHLHMLITAARMYYEHDQSQADIADALKKSRPTVSRLLAEARQRGLVHIEVRVPLDRSMALERQLSEAFGLSDVRVVRTPLGSEQQSVDHLGRAAAHYLQSILRDGDTIGVSNGRSLASVAKYLEPERAFHVSIVQIIGAMGNGHPAIDGPDIVRALAGAYGAQPRYLHVPLMVADAQARTMLSRDRNVAQTLKIGAGADIALVGVGTLDVKNRSPIFEGFLSNRELMQIKQAGGIGHICAQFFDESGQLLGLPLNDHTFGIGLESLKKVPNVVAVAGGRTKAAAIVAGIRGGYVDTLITDDSAAKVMLTIAERFSDEASAS